MQKQRPDGRYRRTAGPLTNIVQVQRWLGHHSPSFTLDTYVHLLDGNLGAPLAPLQGQATAPSDARTPSDASDNLQQLDRTRATSSIRARKPLNRRQAVA